VVVVVVMVIEVSAVIVVVVAVDSANALVVVMVFVVVVFRDFGDGGGSKRGMRAEVGWHERTEGCEQQGLVGTNAQKMRAGVGWLKKRNASRGWLARTHRTLRDVNVLKMLAGKLGIRLPPRSLQCARATMITTARARAARHDKGVVSLIK
jgi:hypothetical protein